jgi:hypothetical protein
MHEVVYPELEEEIISDDPPLEYHTPVKGITPAN